MNDEAAPSARRSELLEAAYAYVLANGLAAMSLRPLAKAVGSSPRVLLYLFGSKDGLVLALLARARADELAMLGRLDGSTKDGAGLDAVAREVWSWLAAPAHRALLTLWVEAYGQSLVDPAGPWGGFARSTVDDWLAVLARAQSPHVCGSRGGRSQATVLLAVLRGALLDLLATGDVDRTTAAVEAHLATLGAARTAR